MPERDELDRLIDSELARYAEPRAGLEQRIFARVSADALGRSSLIRGWQWRALVGTLAVAIILIVAIPWLTHRETSVTPARVTKTDHGLIPNPKIAVPEAHVPIRHLPQMEKKSQSAARTLAKTNGSERPQVSKLDVFPAPQALSPQEQALVAIATARSDSGRENLIASQRQLSAPLQISAIDIPDITMPDAGKE